MYGDFDIEEFDRKWEELVAEFGLENNNQIHELYDKRKMWSIAHTRGIVFVGLGPHLGVKVFTQNLENMFLFLSNLIDFLQHFSDG